MKAPSKSAVNKGALRKAGGKPVNPPVKQKGPGASPLDSASIDRKYEIEDAMRTLMRADELRKDGKLMADVKKHASAQAAKMATICKK